MSPLVSIIVIDYKKENPLLLECLDAIKKQSYTNFEICLLTDYQNDLSFPKLRKKSYGKYVGPAIKRDDGAKMAKGEILAFIDDDAYPDSDWLKSLVHHFSDSQVAGVGGPGVTPPGVSWQESLSGWISASPIGAGPYTYRFLPQQQRYVDDYPSMNLAIRKSDFLKVGGFDSNFWPGEDTKLCLDLVHKLGKKIIYDPKALVFHHRRPLWLPHLRQNGNYGIHRGYFAKILPKTSLRPVYFAPALFFIYICTLLLTLNSQFLTLYSIPFLFYLCLLVLNASWIFSQSRQLMLSLISIPAVLITHLWYGFRFLQGFLFSSPHNSNIR